MTTFLGRCFFSTFITPKKNITKHPTETLKHKANISPTTFDFFRCFLLTLPASLLLRGALHTVALPHQVLGLRGGSGISRSPGGRWAKKVKPFGFWLLDRNQTKKSFWLVGLQWLDGFFLFFLGVGIKTKHQKMLRITVRFARALESWEDWTRPPSSRNRCLKTED